MGSWNKKTLSLGDMMPTIREALVQGKSVRFVPGGSSMLPMLYPNRDTVVLSPLPEKLKKYDLPLYQRENGDYVLHRVVKTGQTYTCIGDNQFFREAGLRHEQMIGLVTEFIRDGKTISVTSFGYRLYCRFWHYSRFPRRCWRKLRRVLAGGKKA